AGAGATVPEGGGRTGVGSGSRVRGVGAGADAPGPVGAGLGESPDGVGPGARLGDGEGVRGLRFPEVGGAAGDKAGAGSAGATSCAGTPGLVGPVFAVRSFGSLGSDAGVRAGLDPHPGGVSFGVSFVVALPSEAKPPDEPLSRIGCRALGGPLTGIGSPETGPRPLEVPDGAGVTGWPLSTCTGVERAVALAGPGGINPLGAGAGVRLDPGFGDPSPVGGLPGAVPGCSPVGPSPDRGVVPLRGLNPPGGGGPSVPPAAGAGVVVPAGCPDVKPFFTWDVGPDCSSNL